MTPPMTLRLALAALALALPAAAAHADEEPPQTTVEFHDLDLTDPADRERLDTRIRSGARSICRSGQLGVVARAAERRCIEVALASARPQVAAAVLRAGGLTRIALVRPGHGA